MEETASEVTNYLIEEEPSFHPPFFLDTGLDISVHFIPFHLFLNILYAFLNMIVPPKYIF